MRVCSAHTTNQQLYKSDMAAAGLLHTQPASDSPGGSRNKKNTQAVLPCALQPDSS